MEDKLERLVADDFTRYDVVLMVATRARELMSGSPPQVECRSTNPIAIALQEFREGTLDVGKRRSRSAKRKDRPDEVVPQEKE